MAPIRRYLRITKFSILECRIYLDNPALAESWLLNPRNPILPRVIESVRPLVLPKLREENERARGKGKGKGKKKGVKDVVVQDDFEVSIFLTETSTRHSLLTKQKHFRDKGREGLKSNSNKLIGATDDAPIPIEDVPRIRREESDNSMAGLLDIPAVESDDEDGLFVPDEPGQKRSRPTLDDIPSSPGFEPLLEPLPKRRKEDTVEAGDDKKKMAMDTIYDGFAIYGRVLCLVVKRKDKSPAITAGQAIMEDWITSTQMPLEEDAS